MTRPKFEFPQQASTSDDLLKTIALKKQKDINWRKGRAFCLIYHPGDEREHTIKKVFDQYYADNALNPTATPSLVELETETVSMCADLLNGDEEVCGNVTSGGTESIILAVKTARDWAKANKPGIKRPHVVIPESVHPAFIKAFHFLDVDFSVAKTDSTYAVSMAEIEKAITPNTVLLVGS
ncbi:MAG TPA: hypothetical protein PLW44_14400, partial [Chitinophagales bacterium]|nr:hypothetical protein [Chitinophagales bacterium]